MSEKKNTNKIKNIFIEENQFRFNNPEYNKLFEKNLFIINIKKDQFDCHGLEKVLSIIYEKFQKDKINIDDVKKVNGDNKTIFPLLKHSSFLKNINSSGDILEYIKNYCSFEIYSATVMTVLVEDLEFLPFFIFLLFFGIQICLITSITISLGVTIEKKKAAELLKSSTGTTAALGILGYVLASALKLIPEVGTIIGGL